MASAVGIERVESTRVPRHLAWDAVFVGLSGVHGAAIALAPIVPVIAIGLWWNANTISHNFIHRPFFRSRAANRLYSAYLTLLLGFPQTLWRERHLRHHGAIGRSQEIGRSQSERPYDPPQARIVGPFGFRRAVIVELLLLVALWSTLAALAPAWLLTVYLPGWAIGLGLCQLQGHYEHARGTTSHYGRMYNFLFFNDGLHVEHHARPGAHWTELGGHIRPDTTASRWPPVLRWLDAISLQGLERLVLKSPALQRFVVGAHRRALARLLPLAGDVRRVVVVGGGLFPRTAIVLRDLLPSAKIVVVDASAEHLAIAQRVGPGGVVWEHRAFDPRERLDADLVVIPLSFNGRRADVYAWPPARAVLVHDWIVNRRTPSAVVSWLLLKRLNLIVSPEARLRRP